MKSFKSVITINSIIFLQEHDMENDEKYVHHFFMVPVVYLRL